MKKLLIILAAALTATACTTLNPYAGAYTYVTLDYQESTARILEGEHAMLTTPIVADLEVSNKRITHIEKDAFKDIEVDSYTTQPLAIMGYKKIALSKATKANDADVLVGTMIDVETIDGRFVITVTGFPAKYVNFRKATSEDTKLAREAYILRSNNSEAIIASPTEDERIHLTNK